MFEVGELLLLGAPSSKRFCLILGQFQRQEGLSRTAFNCLHQIIGIRTHSVDYLRIFGVKIAEPDLHAKEELPSHRQHL